MKLYSIYDRQTQAYNQPFPQPTHGAAMRAITNEMEQQNSMLGKHHGDYELWCVGAFDSDSGAITANKEKVVSLSELVKGNS